MGAQPHSHTLHISVVYFVEIVHGEEHSSLGLAFDRMRRKRHIAVYDAVGTISKSGSKNAINRAKKLLDEF